MIKVFKSKEGSITLGAVFLLVIIISSLLFFTSVLSLFILKQKTASLSKNIASSLATNISYDEFMEYPRVIQENNENKELIRKIVGNKHKDIIIEEEYFSNKDNEFITEVRITLNKDSLKMFGKDNIGITSKSQFRTFLDDDYWEMYLYEFESFDDIDVDFYLEEIQIEEVF